MNELTDQLKGKQLFVPAKMSERGFEFHGSKIWRGLRLIVASDWKFEYYDSVVFDSRRPAKVEDAYGIMHFQRGWNIIEHVGAKPGSFLKIRTKYCLLDIQQFDASDESGIKVRVDSDGQTIYKDWSDSADPS